MHTPVAVMDSKKKPALSNNATTGKYATEEEAKLAFISHVNDSHWDVLQEVTGDVIFPKIGCSRESVRADYVLFPKESLISAGWSVGPICVEVKRSGKELGPVICQAQDYMRCAFRAPNGIVFIPSFCVVFPLRSVTGAVQSIMSDGKIGHAYVDDRDDRLCIHLNGALAHTHGGIFLRSAIRSGRKFGSR